MAASGGGAISRFQNVETKGNFYSLTPVGAKKKWPYIWGRGIGVIETWCAEQLTVCNFARVSVSLRSDVDFCVLQCPHFVMFGNRDGSVHTLLLCLVTVTVLSLVIDECVYGSSLRNIASHAVLALRQISPWPTEAVLRLTFISLATLFRYISLCRWHPQTNNFHFVWT
jgi:hypothetical protein